MPQRSKTQVSWLCLLVLMPTQLEIQSESQTRGGLRSVQLGHQVKGPVTSVEIHAMESGAERGFGK